MFTYKLVDDRSEYFKLPFNHRADIARVPDWVHEAVVYNIFPDSFATSRRYISGEATQREFGGLTTHGKLGGTIRGVTENLDYLSGLGINCVSHLEPGIFAAGEYRFQIRPHRLLPTSTLASARDEDFREPRRVGARAGQVCAAGSRRRRVQPALRLALLLRLFEDVAQKGEASRCK
ncbi:MAG: hypothetical protein ACLTSG_06030 [Lachnospiraceae bacterium]